MNNDKVPFALSVLCPYPSANSHSCALTLYTYDSSGSVGIKDNNSFIKSAVKIFPNPSTGEYNVDYSSDSESILTYRLSNLLGQTVITNDFKVQTGQNSFVLNANCVNEGIYIFTIFKGGKPVFSEKLIKQ